MFKSRRSVGLVSITVVFGVMSMTVVAQSQLTAKVTSPPAPVSTVVENDRSRDGLVGPVRRVRTEIVKLSSETGKLAEGKRAVLEIVAYDIKGAKIENQYFPIAGANLTGKEVYKYDDKGNISEMILTNDDGSLVSKEVYKYEFDFVGNWNKMSTSVAVIDAGKISFEPTEVTYRSIMYYLDENMLRMAQPASAAAIPATSMPSPSVDAKNNTSSLKSSGSESANNNPTAAQKSVAVPKTVVTMDKLAGVGPMDPGARAPSGSSSVLVKLEGEPPPPPAPRPILKPVSGGVLNGNAISLPSPSYPDQARRMRVSGAVTIEVVHR